MLPNFLPQPGLMLRLLLELEQGQANGTPVECLYVGTFVLSDRGQVLEVTEEMIDQLIRNFAALDGPERIPISVNHNTGGDTLATARAIGWIIRLFKQTNDEGRISLFMEPRWLDDAREAIEQEHFRFVSIGMYLNDKHPTSGEEIGAHAREISICNCPAIPGLEPITLTALNAPSKVALSTQAVMALHPGNPMGLRMGEGLSGSLMERVDCVIRCFYEKNPDSNEQMWIVRDVSTDQCIVSRRNGEGEKTWQVGYAMEAGGSSCTFAPMPQWIEVRQVYVPVTVAASQVKPSPKPVGKTGNSANLHQQQHPQAAGTKPAASTHKEQKKMDETQLRSLLGLAADADIGSALTALKKQADQQITLANLQGVTAQLIACAGACTSCASECSRCAEQCATTDPECAAACTACATACTVCATQCTTCAAHCATAPEPGSVTQMATKLEEMTTMLKQKTDEVTALTRQRQAFEQETTTLATRLQALETERNERDAKDRLDLALKNRKVKPAELEAEGGFLKTLAKEQPSTFDKIMSARPAYAVDLTVEVGSGAEGAPEENAADQLFRLTDEALAKDADLKPQDARKMVLAAHPELRGAIKTATAG